MCKFIYKWLVENKAAKYEFDISDAIEIMEKYGLFNSLNANVSDDLKKFTYVGGDGAMINDVCYFKQVREGCPIYDMFFGNLHIHVNDGEDQKIYSIRIKKQEESWVCPIKDNRIDPSHPTNDNYEVYVWYRVPILDITKVDGYVYHSGSWDKVVYREMFDFFNAVNEETLRSRFNANYRKKKDEKKVNE